LLKKIAIAYPICDIAPFVNAAGLFDDKSNDMLYERILYLVNNPRSFAFSFHQTEGSHDGQVLRNHRLRDI